MTLSKGLYDIVASTRCCAYRSLRHARPGIGSFVLSVARVARANNIQSFRCKLEAPYSTVTEKARPQSQLSLSRTFYANTIRLSESPGALARTSPCQWPEGSAASGPPPIHPCRPSESGEADADAGGLARTVVGAGPTRTRVSLSVAWTRTPRPLLLRQIVTVQVRPGRLS